MTHGDSKSSREWYTQISKAIRSDQCDQVKALMQDTEMVSLEELLALALRNNAERVIPMLANTVSASNRYSPTPHTPPEKALVKISHHQLHEEVSSIAAAVVTLLAHGFDACAAACQSAADAHWTRILFRASPFELLDRVPGPDAKDYCWARLAAPI